MSACDYHDLPLDEDGWHIREDPEGMEPTQRIPCMLPPPISWHDANGLPCACLEPEHAANPRVYPVLLTKDVVDILGQ